MTAETSSYGLRQFQKDGEWVARNIDVLRIKYRDQVIIR